ncbi:YrzE family protein [Maioricimonas sp. JC845]|uniref:YrzE family protein n=1 Tax=Maioricimonas sp. JC845 TaxID=3232138 RepID=UPI0034584BA7
MTLRPERYYRNAGVVPFKGTMMMLIAGGLVAIVLSFVYAVIDYYNPFIYFTFIATAILGAAIGGAVHWGGNAGAVRNRGFRLIVGIACGLIGVYFSWVWFIFILAEWNAEAIILDPLQMANLIQFLAANGVWEIQGQQPTGMALYAVWLIEAGMIFGIAAMTAGQALQPYCEPCGRWTEAVDEVLFLPKTDVPALQADLEEERYEALDKLAEEEVDRSDCLSVTVQKCPECDESNFLSVGHLTVTQSKEGPQVNTKPLITGLAVPDDVVEGIRERARQAEEAMQKAFMPAETGEESVETESLDDTFDEGVQPADREQQA